MPIDAGIRSKIKDKGYVTIDEVMRQVLSDNSNSYYRNVKNIGEKGDFITSPEVSQLFGEMISLWLINKWKSIGSPSNFCLLELGPGQGTLMKDILRTCTVIAPDMLKAMRSYLYEINPYFITKQQKNLTDFENIKWINSFNNLPKMPLIVIANEFFDALPIKQYVKIGKYWRENVLIIDPGTSILKPHNVALTQNLRDQLALEHPNANDCSVLEESLEAMQIIRFLSKNISEFGGGMLLIDYGYHIDPAIRTSRQYVSTLQAVKHHQFVPIIDYLGEADLSAHVDFCALQKAASEYGNFHYNYSSQGDFLQNYGIKIRANSLKEKSETKLHYIIDRQLERLTSFALMGELFKVFEINSLEKK